MASQEMLLPGDIQKLKVADLRRLLKARGLPQTGNKLELTERLRAAVGTEDNTLGDDDEDVLEDDVLADDGKASDDVSFQDEIILNSPTATESPLKLLPVSVEKTKKVVEKDEVEDDATNNNNSDSSCEEKVSVVKLKGLSDDEKLALRAKKFNLPATDEVRKEARAERFGISNAGKTGTSLNDSERIKKRAERFGVSKIDDSKKLNLRAQRFGLNNTNNSNKVQNTEAQLLKRKERFGTVSESEDLEAKKKKRAARFGLI